MGEGERDSMEECESEESGRAMVVMKVMDMGESVCVVEAISGEADSYALRHGWQDDTVGPSDVKKPRGFLPIHVCLRYTHRIVRDLCK